ncbi:unnamed protein product [Hymenolepis diminuta]|uniref:HTH psq-type domain-containing protein n=2 Tax=Hymenolepis diminuta TaxID=6216 RepID=A0A158QDZ4_HYMDI|nr:unnamed protein product [Hymenolepis diminuta]
MAEKASGSTEELQSVTEGFSCQMNRILNEYVAIYRILLERQHTANETRLQSGGCMFPFLSSTHYIPVPPPAILSSYLRGENDFLNFLLKSAAAFSYYGNKKVPLPRRRPYTASELASAVRAICSGQLGTRRAASVYGIPRSTLRNKICKLNEIRRHEESRRGGRHISLTELIKQYSSTGTSQSDRYSSSRVASVFKVI